MATTRLMIVIPSKLYINSIEMKKKEQPELDDFYTNINMVAQVISPMLWVFFYLPAMKGKVIKHSKLFTATYIGGLYKR